MYFLIRLIDLIAEIAFLQVSLTCCLKLSSLSSMTPYFILTLSDTSIIVLPNENWERTGFRTKREVNWITSVFPGLQSNMFCVFQFIMALTRLVHVDLYWKAATNEHCIQEVDSYQIGLRTNQYVRHGDHFFLQTQPHSWAHFETTGALHSTKYSGYSMRRMQQYLPVRWTNQS